MLVFINLILLFIVDMAVGSCTMIDAVVEATHQSKRTDDYLDFKSRKITIT